MLIPDRRPGEMADLFECVADQYSDSRVWQDSAAVQASCAPRPKLAELTLELKFLVR